MDNAFGDLLLEYTAPEWKQPRWLSGPRMDDPASQLAYARKLEQSGSLSAAADEYDALVREWHSSPEAPQAQVALARAQEARGRKAKAFREYQYALLAFPGSVPYGELVNAQMALLRDMEGELGTGFLGMGATMDAEDLARLYRAVAVNAPGSPLAPECYFRMGELYSGPHCGHPDKALDPYETVMARYPQSAWAPVAAFQSARARVMLCRKYPRDEKRTRAALLSIDSVLATWVPRMADPDTARAELREWRREVYAQQSHADFEQAEFYDTIRRKPEAAIAAYQRFLQLHPDATESTRARQRLAELGATAP